MSHASRAAAAPRTRVRARATERQLRTDIRRVDRALTAVLSVAADCGGIGPQRFLALTTPLVEANGLLWQAWTVVVGGGWWGRVGRGRLKRARIPSGSARQWVYSWYAIMSGRGAN